MMSTSRFDGPGSAGGDRNCLNWRLEGACSAGGQERLRRTGVILAQRCVLSLDLNYPTETRRYIASLFQTTREELQWHAHIKEGKHPR